MKGVSRTVKKTRKRFEAKRSIDMQRRRDVDVDENKRGGMRVESREEDMYLVVRSRRGGQPKPKGAKRV